MFYRSYLLAALLVIPLTLFLSRMSDVLVEVGYAGGTLLYFAFGWLLMAMADRNRVIALQEQAAS